MAWLIVVFLVATAVVATIGPRLARVAGSDAVGLVGLAVLLNGVLLAGLVRQRSGAHRTDTESWSIIAIWLVAVVLILLWHPAVPSCRAVPSWCAVLVCRPGAPSWFVGLL